MYHLAPFLPLAALVVFWLLPVAPALLVFVAMAAVSAFVSMAVFNAHQRQVTTGAEGLIGAHARVVRAEEGRLVVRVQGALWSSDTAGFRELPTPGDSVMVVGLAGNSLLTMPLHGRVRRFSRTAD